APALGLGIGPRTQLRLQLEQPREPVRTFEEPGLAGGGDRVDGGRRRAKEGQLTVEIHFAEVGVELLARELAQYAIRVALEQVHEDPGRTDRGVPVVAAPERPKAVMIGREAVVRDPEVAGAVVRRGDRAGWSRTIRASGGICGGSGRAHGGRVDGRGASSGTSPAGPRLQSIEAGEGKRA